jgi:aspartyl protease family protein
MRTEFIGAVICVCATVVAVKHFETERAKAEVGAEPILAAASGPTASAPRVSYGREVRLPAGENHQYFVTAAVNRRPASFLVDTGASYVALRESDAYAAKIRVTRADYKYPVRTANGETNAAMVDIDVIEIDGIRVDGVKAFILPDEQLGVNLLGMSFLSKLESVEQRGGELVLKG